MKLYPTAYIWLMSAATALAVDPAHGEGEQESLFAGSFAQSIAAVIVFSILVVVLHKFAWGPILKGLQDREGKIADDLRQAQAASNEAKATLERYQDQLAQAEAETGRIIDQSRTDAQKIATDLKEQTRAEIDQMRQRAGNDILAAKQQALNDIYTQAASLATTVAGRILQREVSAEDHQQLIRESLEELKHN